MAGDMKCEILDTLLELQEERGYHLERTLIKWVDNAPKYDLRRWNEDRSRMTKGITLTEDELELLRNELPKVKF